MIRKLKYTVDLTKIKGLTPEQIAESGKDKQKKLFEEILNQGLHSRYQTGIGGRMQRDFSHILNELDTTEKDYLELEESWFDLIKEILTSESARFLPGQTRLIMLYDTNIKEAEEAAAKKIEKDKEDSKKKKD